MATRQSLPLNALWRDGLRPVDAASLAFFRIAFGLLLAVAMVRLLVHGWVDSVFLAPTFHFTYPGFGWVRPLAAGWMHMLVALLAGCGLGLAAGFYYRVCAVIYFLGFTYLELIERANYLNHYYLVSLLVLLMAVLPLHRLWSWDAVRKPATAGEFLPAWRLWLLRFQIGVVYVFAGLAKLNADWLIEAQPLRFWLAARSDLPLIGPWLGEESVAHAMSWGGAAYDLGIVLALLCARTRAMAFVTVIVFHVLTWVLFPIGMFPWIMIVATTLFFPPDWPRRWLRGKREPAEPSTACFGAPHRLLIGLIAAYCVVQVVVPLRPLFERENSAWTFRGFNFSWRVMLAEKSGYTDFYAMEPATGRRRYLRAREWLTPWQERIMAQDPELIGAFARHLAGQLAREGETNVEVHVEAYASLNGRPVQQFIRPGINLAATPPADWIVPLQER